MGGSSTYVWVIRSFGRTCHFGLCAGSQALQHAGCLRYFGHTCHIGLGAVSKTLHSGAFKFRCSRTCGR
eukprot:6492150-Amphidinium_carterae.3